MTEENPIDRFERLLGSIAERPDVQESLRVAREKMRDDATLAAAFGSYVDRLEGAFRDSASQMVRDSFHRIDGILLRRQAEEAMRCVPSCEKPHSPRPGVIRARDFKRRSRP